MRKGYLIAALAALSGLTACSSEQIALAERGRQELKGMRDADLFACAGEPVARHRENGADLWVYFRESTGSAAMSVERETGPLARPAEDYDYFRYCEATFVLRQGRVSEVLMKGRTALGRETLQACGPIVAKCLR